MLSTNYDVIVIGSGHAGIEASLASARMGCKTLVCTTSIQNIGLMPCNPSIGGPAKGQIVGEIDALGGEMGKAADETHIQLKVLNRSRGPAVQCLRSQNDKAQYNSYMKNILLNQENLTALEAEATGLLIENNQVQGIQTNKGTFYAKSVAVTTGTFLKGKMHTGLSQVPGGRIDENPSNDLSDSLAKHFRLGRLKTGTPPRLHKNSIDYDHLELAPGDPEFLHFSFKTPYNERFKSQIDCHISRTNPDTHEYILNNLDRSPLYTHVIQGTGPRYCPSIEDKIVRFKDKDSHHIFIEPEGTDTDSIYPQGLNTSLPEDVQDAFLRTMKGLKDVKILKFGYAVEYDFIYPDQLTPTLEAKSISGLFFAGQINGTSGYEEAGGQGIVAGINAGLKAQKKPPLILTRTDSFIGTMIDDLITKNIYEPYRMLTSRSEYRLLLRQDNPTFRLSQRAHEIGLISDTDLKLINEQKEQIGAHIKTWKKTSTPKTIIEKFSLKQAIPIYNFLKRPNTSLNDIADAFSISIKEKETAEKALIEIRYEGYISKQTAEIQKLQKQESKKIPLSIDFTQILGLKKESQQKLNKYKPKTIFDAKKIAGINPADIMVLLSYLEKRPRAQSDKTLTNHDSRNK